MEDSLPWVVMDSRKDSLEEAGRTETYTVAHSTGRTVIRLGAAEDRDEWG